MSNYVYYVCYGSNLHQNRFQEYLDNSLYSYSSRAVKDDIDLWEELIASNTEQELESLRVNLTHDVYYKGYSYRWGGGIAYLDVNKYSCKKVYRAYKITRQQFASVFSQENGYYPDSLPWDTILETERTQTSAGFYDMIVNLGQIKGLPALTFTSSDPFEQSHWNDPGEKYRDVIDRGRQETRRLPFVEIE